MDETAAPAPMYMAETLVHDFYHGDPTGLTDPNDRIDSHVIVDGPYTEPVFAERALDIRIERLRPECVSVTSQLNVTCVGMYEEHGGAKEWTRTIVWSDLGGKFEPKEAWQRVRLVRVDQLP